MKDAQDALRKAEKALPSPSESVWTGGADLLVHIADLAAGGVIGAYAVDWRDRAARSFFERRQRRFRRRAPEVSVVVAAARWAVNQRYRDVLPPDLEPVSETVSVSRWKVTFVHDGNRFTAESGTGEVDGRKVDVVMSRERL